MKLKTFIITIIFLVVSFTNQPQSIAKENTPFSSQLTLTDTKINTGIPTAFTKKMRFDFHIGELKSSFTQFGLMYELPGCHFLQIPNCPMLPFKKVTLPLKGNETITSIKLSSIKTIELPKTQATLALCPEPKPISSEDKHLMNSSKQPMPDLFPASNVNCTVIQDKTAKEVVFDIMPMYVIQGRPILATEIEFEYGVGYGDLHQTNLTKGKEKSIILTDKLLEEAAKKLQTIHQKDGYETILILTQDLDSTEAAQKPVVQGVQGFMDVPDSEKTRIAKYDYTLARKIQTWLQQQNNDAQPVFLTIFGDATFVPPSYYLISPDNQSDYDRWVPTDFFYISPSTSYVGITGTEIHFDYQLGRLPVRDIQEANDVVSKIERYRKSLQAEWFKRFAMFAGDPFNEDFFGELSTSKAVNENYLDGFDIEKYYRSEGLFSTNPFLKVMREGKRGMVWAFGHGSGDGLALEPGYVDAKLLYDLPEKNEYPIVLSEACGNGAYDSRLANPSFGSAKAFQYPTSFSEAILNSKGGGIAYVGGARINYAGWSMVYQNGIPTLQRIYYMDAILEYFFKCFTKEGGSLGSVALNTLQEYAENDWFAINAPFIKTFFGFCLQGDPTIRLPSLTDQKYEKTPEIKVNEILPKTQKQIPLFSIDDGRLLSVSSDSKKVRTIVVDYDNESKRIVKDEWVQNPNQSITVHLQKYPKSRLAFRCLTPDGKENRVVFYGRYNHDIVIRKPYDLDWIGRNEQKSYYCQVFNDGMVTESDVQVSIKRQNKMIKEENIDEIPVLGSQYVYYQTKELSNGKESITIEGSILPGETAIADNVLNFPLLVTEQKPIRVGILNISSSIDFAYYYDRLMLNTLNQYFRDHEHRIDFSILPLGMDRYYETLLTKLHYDAVILYSHNSFPYPMHELISILTKFSNEGGFVFAMLPLGYSGNGVSLHEWQPFFGIDPSEKFTQINLEDKPASFDMQGTGESLFPEISYKLSSRYANKPPKKNWDQVKLLENSELIGISETGLYSLVKFKNRFLFSGFLSEKDLKKPDDSMLFFEHLFSVLEQEYTDISIREATIQAVHDNRDLEIQFSVLNAGNTLVESAQLLIGDQPIQEVRALLPKESEEISILIASEHINSSSTLSFCIVLPDPLSDQFPENNLYHMEYKPDAQQTIHYEALSKEQNQTDWVPLSLSDELVSPSCVDVDNDSLFISQANGILEFDMQGNLKHRIPYDPDLIKAFGTSVFRKYSSMPTRSFLRKKGNYIFISGPDCFALIDYPSGRMIHLVSGIEYENYLTPLVRFNQCFDIEISGKTAYVLDPYFGLSVVNIETGNLLTKIPVSDYLWDFSIQGEQLVGCTFYGSIFTMNLKGTDQQFYYPSEEMYCSSFLCTSDGNYFINSYYPERILSKVMFKNDSMIIEKKITLPSSMKGFLERMVCSGNYFEVIGYAEKKIGSFGMESKWYRLDKSIEKAIEPGKNFLRDIYKLKHYMTHPENVWITENKQILVSMGMPSNPFLFKLFDTDGLLIKNIKTSSDLYDSSVLCKQYLGNDTIAIVFSNRGYWVHFIEFTDKVTYRTIEIDLDSTRQQVIPEQFLFTDEALLLLDKLTGNIFSFDLETGSEIDRFPLITDYKTPTLWKTSMMLAWEDKLFLLDPINHHLLEFEISSGSFLRSYPLPNIQFDASNPLILNIVSGNEFLILDPVSGQLFHKSPVFSHYWNPLLQADEIGFWQNPVGFDYKDGYLVVNDLGHERIQLYKP